MLEVCPACEIAVPVSDMYTKSLICAMCHLSLLLHLASL